MQVSEDIQSQPYLVLLAFISLQVQDLGRLHHCSQLSWCGIKGNPGNPGNPDPRHHVGDEGRNKGEPHRRVGCYCSPLAWLGHNFGFKKANRHHQEGDSCTSVQTCTNRFKEKNNWFCIAKALLSNNHISMYGANNHISMYDFWVYAVCIMAFTKTLVETQTLLPEVW